VTINRICFLAGSYPSKDMPASGVFYKELVDNFSKMGIDCRVIHPFPVNLRREKPLSESVEAVDQNHSITVYRPNCFSFGAKKIAFWNTAYLTAKSYTRASASVFKYLDWRPDVLYGHFISPAGIVAARLSQITGIPAFIAYGESRPWSIETIGVKRSQRLLSSVNGFIAVSSKNKKELLEYGIADEERIAVFPNGVDRNIFYPRDKEEARKTLGWSLDKFVVIFVGHFNERKGLLRLDEAVKNLDDVFVAYVGEGKLRPTAKNTLHCGPVEHARLPLLLSAADIFVLPTLHEGCCNAIIEALACGLPVVSSNLDFNKDVLNNDNSLLIDPHKIDEIRAAIIKIKENPALHKLLRNGAIESASRFDLARRTARIVAWMEEKI